MAQREMAALVSERVGIKKTGVTTSVPPNSKAKLMYYLDCVATLIELNNPNLRRLRDYQTYYLLNDAETDALLALVRVLSPDKLVGKVMFQREDCGGSRNEFYELSAVSHMLAVTDNIVIGGGRKRVAKIMFFQKAWMKDNYSTPIRSFLLARELPGRAPSSLRAPLLPSVDTPPSYRDDECCKDCDPCMCLLCCNIL